jgi:hypothetical protein
MIKMNRVVLWLHATQTLAFQPKGRAIQISHLVPQSLRFAERFAGVKSRKPNIQRSDKPVFTQGVITQLQTYFGDVNELIGVSA